MSDVRYVTTTKHSASVIMLGVVASNGEKMPPVWFKGGYRLTGADYRDILATKVLPWIRKIVKGGWCSSAHVQKGPRLDEPEHDFLAPTIVLFDFLKRNYTLGTYSPGLIYILKYVHHCIKYVFA